MQKQHAKKYSFKVRYGIAVLDAGGITSIPSILYRYGATVGLTPQDRDFICHCLTYKWTNGDPYPSMQTLTKRMGVSLSTVKRIAKRLEEKDLLKKEHRVGKGGKYPSLLDFSGLWETLLNGTVERKEESSATHGERARKTIHSGRGDGVSDCGTLWVTCDPLNGSQLRTIESEAVYESEEHNNTRTEDEDNDAGKDDGGVELPKHEQERQKRLTWWMSQLGMTSNMIEWMVHTYDLAYLEEKQQIYGDLLNNQYAQRRLRNPPGFYHYLVKNNIQDGPPIGGPPENYDPIWHLFDPETRTGRRHGEPLRLGEVLSRNGTGVCT